MLSVIITNAILLLMFVCHHGERDCEACDACGACDDDVVMFRLFFLFCLFYVFHVFGTLFSFK